MNQTVLSCLKNKLLSSAVSGGHLILLKEELDSFPDIPVFERLKVLLSNAAEGIETAQAKLEAYLLTDVLLSSLNNSNVDLDSFEAYPEQAFNNSPLPYRTLVSIQTLLRGKSRDKESTLAPVMDKLRDIRLLNDMLEAFDNDNAQNIVSRALNEWDEAIVTFIKEYIRLSANTQTKARLLQVIASLSEERELPYYRHMALYGDSLLKAEAITLLARYSSSDEDRIIVREALLSEDNIVRDAAYGVFIKDNTDEAEDILIGLVCTVQGKERLSSAITALCRRESLSDNAVELIEGLDFSGLNDTAAVYCLSLLADRQIVLPSLESVVKNHPAAAAVYVVRVCDPSVFFDIYANERYQVYARDAILQFPGVTTDERWVNFFASRNDGLMVVNVAKCAGGDAEEFLSSFDIRRCGQSGDCAALLTFGAYPLTLMKLGVYDFWDNLCDSLESFIEDKWRKNGRFPDILFDPGLMNVLAVNGEWLSDRVKEDICADGMELWLENLREASSLLVSER